MSEDGKFDDHIEKVVSKVRQKIGWMLRTFYTRRMYILKQLWKTLIQCHIDYCSQLYMPGQSQGLQAIEKLFYDFSSRKPEVRQKVYSTGLEILKMYYEERRMERYRINNSWKIFGRVDTKLWCRAII